MPFRAPGGAAAAAACMPRRHAAHRLLVWAQGAGCAGCGPAALCRALKSLSARMAPPLRRLDSALSPPAPPPRCHAPGAQQQAWRALGSPRQSSAALGSPRAVRVQRAGALGLREGAVKCRRPGFIRTHPLDGRAEGCRAEAGRGPRCPLPAFVMRPDAPPRAGGPGRSSEAPLSRVIVFKSLGPPACVPVWRVWPSPPGRGGACSGRRARLVGEPLRRATPCRPAGRSV